MSDDFSKSPSEQNSRDLPASAIFTEMMQQAAERQSAPRAESPSVEASAGDEPAAQHRVRRIKRRREHHRRTRAAATSGFLRTLFVVLVSTGLAATVLTWFTDPQFLNPAVVRGLQANEAVLIASGTTTGKIAPTVAATPNWLHRIGIVSGHRGPNNDPGAVCEDGLREADINFEVAQRVVMSLRARNYVVDLLDEFDSRLDNYRAAALLSIHANDCQDYGEYVSGYLVAKAAARPEGGIDAYFAECLAFHYEQLIPLERRYTLTRDMTHYHTFREIYPLTPAAIIELGFMRADRRLLTEEPDLLAQALVNGILCLLGPAEGPPKALP